MSLPIFFALLVCAVATSANASDEIDNEVPFVRLHASLGYHYSSGSYGDPQKTWIAYVPLVIRGEIDAWTIGLTLPYLHIQGPAGIFGPLAGNTDETPPGGEEEDPIKRVQGQGDILLEASYTLWPWATHVPFLTGTGRIKFPTASEKKGLGTGALDFYVSAQAVWSARGLTPFLEIGYEHLSDSSEVDLNEAGRVSAGAAYNILNDVGLGISLDYGSPTSDDSGHRVDLVPFLTWRIADAWSLGTYGSAGLASGSPDVGVGVQLGHRLFETGM
jgi:hypothetical protein